METAYDFYTTKLKISGTEAPCLLFECNHNEPLKRECSHLGYRVYEIRHSDNNWSDPKTIEETVYANFWGYIALKNETVKRLLSKKLAKDKSFQVNSFSLNRFGDEAEYYSRSKLSADLI